MEGGRLLSPASDCVWRGRGGRGMSKQQTVIQEVGRWAGNVVFSEILEEKQTSCEGHNFFLFLNFAQPYWHSSRQSLHRTSWTRVPQTLPKSPVGATKGLRYKSGLNPLEEKRWSQLLSLSYQSLWNAPRLPGSTGLIPLEKWIRTTHRCFKHEEFLQSLLMTFEKAEKHQLAIFLHQKRQKKPSK